jgi:type II secretory pathway pseudopilin PulG
MKKIRGFTLVELILFITVTGILASTILLSSLTLLRNTPSIQSNLVASAYATQNAEYYIGLRHTLGYSAIPCPNTTVPSFDTTIAGYVLTESIACTTISSDANYKTLTVNVVGTGGNTGSATVTVLFANY